MAPDQGRQAGAPRSSRAERRLVRDVLRGDPEAIRTLVKTYWPRAQRIGQLISHDTLAAEDIAQEALSDAIESLERFDRRRALGPWLDRIAANKAHDWVRRRSRRPEALIDEEELASQLISEPFELSDEFADTDVAIALRDLDPRQREAIVFRHLLDFEPAEIADIVDAPAATVRTRLHRGLKALRSQLEQGTERSRDERAR